MNDAHAGSAGAQLLFPANPAPVVPIVGQTGSFPVHRIFCVGRNYADHAKEMGSEVDREQPWYFMKPASAIAHSGATIAYPGETKNYHYEMELVVAIGAPAFRVSVADARHAVYGYACGLDMTRRDLQAKYKEQSRPWDLAKGFDNAAPIGTITPATDFAPLGDQRIWLKVGESFKQDGKLSSMVWSVPELISHLSRFTHLMPGDLIYTGTPGGVGPVVTGDVLTGGIDGLAPVTITIGPAE